MLLERLKLSVHNKFQYGCSHMIQDLWLAQKCALSPPGTSGYNLILHIEIRYCEERMVLVGSQSKTSSRQNGWWTHGWRWNIRCFWPLSFCADWITILTSNLNHYLSSLLIPSGCNIIRWILDFSSVKCKRVYLTKHGIWLWCPILSTKCAACILMHVSLSIELRTETLKGKLTISLKLTAINVP